MRVLWDQGISSSSKAGRESESVDGTASRSTELNGSSYGDRRVLHQLSASTGSCRRSRANSHHMMSIADYTLPITVSYLNYLKQRKVRVEVAISLCRNGALLDSRTQLVSAVASRRFAERFHWRRTEANRLRRSCHVIRLRIREMQTA
jgi:hypothetical protein